MSEPSVTITGDMLSDLTHAWISECPECHGLLGVAYFDPHDPTSTKAAAEFAEGWDRVVVKDVADELSWFSPGHQVTCSRKGKAH